MLMQKYVKHLIVKTVSLDASNLKCEITVKWIQTYVGKKSDPFRLNVTQYLQMRG
jgi:hypothetical protein